MDKVINVSDLPKRKHGKKDIIAKRHGVYKNRDRNIKIRCINTNIVYNSISEASKCTGMNASSIGMVCHGKRKYNKGKNGEKIYWEIIHNSNFNTINDIV